MNGAVPASARPPARGETGVRNFIVFMAALPLLALGEPSEIPSDVRLVAAVGWLLAMAPAVVHYRRGWRARQPLPVLPLVGIAFAAYFPLQIVLGSTNVYEVAARGGGTYLDPARDLAGPVQMATTGWILLLAGYAASALVLPALPAVRPRFAYVRIRNAAGAMLVAGGVTSVMISFVGLPSVLNAVGVFVTSAGAAGAALLLLLNEIRPLDLRWRTWSLVGFAALVVPGVARGGLFAFIVSVTVVGLASVTAGRRVGLRAAVAAVVVVIVGLSVKGQTKEYRRLVVTQAVNGERFGGLQIYGALLGRRYRDGGFEAILDDGATAVSGRSADMDLFADVVRLTPAPVPYWGGDTYKSLVGAFVPRFLWPDKPTKSLGQDFGHRYGYLDPGDLGTSINLPYLVEFYANFGESGVLFGMLIVGVVIRVGSHLYNRRGQDIVTTACGLALLVPPCLSVESDFSLVFGGLILNSAAFWFLRRYVLHYATVRTAPAVARAPERRPSSGVAA